MLLLHYQVFYQHNFKIFKSTFCKFDTEHRDPYKLDFKLHSGEQVELFSFPNRPPRPSFPEALGLRHIAFSVDPVELMYDYLTAKNIHVEPIRMDEYTHKKFTFFMDPDGLPLELFEHIDG